ncbi:hypothetical protein C1N50_15290 [Vibrio campbellii]|nr:hypothetical protein C1N50_15290 [Vibrio campbellii]
MAYLLFILRRKIKMKCAFLICIYRNDNVEHLKEALFSVRSAAEKAGNEARIYIHVDGEVSQEHLVVVDSCNPYKVVKSEKNVGLAIGLNKLIANLEGEDYIFRMDADDICCRDRISLQLDYMEDNPEVDLVGGAIDEFVGDIANVVAHRDYPDVALASYLPKGSPFAHVTVCFRGGFFDKFGCYPTDYPLNEDIALWGEALINGAVGHNIPSTLVQVRMDGAYSRRTLKKAKSELKVYLRICNKLKVFPFIPLARFGFRLMPVSLVGVFYRSSLRNKFLKS